MLQHDTVSTDCVNAKSPIGTTLQSAQAQILNQLQQPRCECHECTQARWKMFAGGGLAQMGRL